MNTPRRAIGRTYPADLDCDYWPARIFEWLERDGAAPRQIENVLAECESDLWFRGIILDGARRASH
ncbi:MAG: hypothetical protein ACREXK_06290 [Gammaproteobacteria bacterium]